MHHCLIHNVYWEICPTSALRGTGCKSCGIEKFTSKTRKSHEQYVKELKEINPNIIAIGQYINAHTNILHKCLIDDYEWNISPLHTLGGNGCPKCAGNIKKTHDEYIKELAIKNPTIEVIEKYVDSKTKITHHCLTHGIYWQISPLNALEGHGCIKCKKERIGDSNRKTHNQYTVEVEKSNPTVKIVGRYINAKTPIKHYCTKHNISWNTIPGNVLNGHGCPECWRDRLRNSLKMTHKQYIKKMREVNPDIEAIESYVDAKTPILHRCKIHDIEWKTSPNSILQGCGCVQCSKEKLHNQLTKSHEQYVNEVKQVNPNISVMGNYINAHTSILHKCLIDDYSWYTAPSYVLSGCGCPKCSNTTKRTHEEYVEDISVNNPNIEVIGKYIDSVTPILHKCLIDGHKWSAAPFSIIRGSGCPKCAGVIKKTHDEYVKELYITNPDIEVLGEYINAKTEILHRCLIHDYKWYTTPHSVLRRNRCPQCHESSGERQIRQWLEKHDIKYVYQKPFKDCYDVKLLPFDFYLPDYNCCIEYDHIQHFEPVEYFGGKEKFKIQQKHDKIKNKYCMNNDIPLLRISYKQNIEEELNNFLFI